MTITYYLQATTTGAFILFRGEFEQVVPTIEFARNYCAFVGAELTIVDENGAAKRTFH